MDYHPLRPKERPPAMRWLRVPGIGLLALMWLGLVAWEIMALWIDGPRARGVAAGTPMMASAVCGIAVTR